MLVLSAHSPVHLHDGAVARPHLRPSDRSLALRLEKFRSQGNSLVGALGAAWLVVHGRLQTLAGRLRRAAAARVRALDALINEEDR